MKVYLLALVAVALLASCASSVKADSQPTQVFVSACNSHGGPTFFQPGFGTHTGWNPNVAVCADHTVWEW